jgi:hypothetical protein
MKPDDCSSAQPHETDAGRAASMSETGALGPPTAKSAEPAPTTGPPETVAKPAPGFGQLGRRITDWTSKLVLSGVVFVVALGFGRQVLQWWAEEPVPATAAGPSRSGVSEESASGPSSLAASNQYTLQFGGSGWKVRTRSFSATADAVTERLAAFCASGEYPAAPSRPAAEAERALLAGLDESATPRWKSGGLKVYTVEEAMPMAVAVRGPKSMASGGTRLSASETAAADVQRVVGWAMAVPQGPSAWTAYLFEASPAAGNGEKPEAARLPLPEEARQTMAVAAPEGVQMLAFRGTGGTVTLRRWRAFFDRALAKYGFRPGPQGPAAHVAAAPGDGTGQERWACRYRPGSDRPEAQAARSSKLPWSRIDVALAAEAAGIIRGVVVARTTMGPDHCAAVSVDHEAKPTTSSTER